MEETTGQPQLPGFHQFLAAPAPHVSILDGTGLFFFIARLEARGFWLPGERRSRKQESFRSVAPSTSSVAVVAGKTPPLWGTVGDEASVIGAFLSRQCSDDC